MFQNLNIKKYSHESLNLDTGKTLALVFAMILLSSFQCNFAYAEQSNDSNFTSKRKKSIPLQSA